MSKTAKPPSAKQLRYLRSLAMQRLGARLDPSSLALLAGPGAL